MITLYTRSTVARLRHRHDIRVLNPRFFAGPEPTAAVVYLNEENAAVRTSYQAAGVPVFLLADHPNLDAPLPSAEASPQKPKGK